MLRDCKYRLPCAWCDKYDRPCEAVQYEVAKQEQEKNSNATKCDHNWEWISSSSVGNVTYRCTKCGTLKFQSPDGAIWESKE